MNMNSVILGVMAGLTSVACADLIEFRFQGTIESTGGSIVAPFDVGAHIDVRYRFETDAFDADPATNFGSYVGAMTNTHAQIGDWEWIIATSGDIGVLDNGFAGDSYGAVVQGPLDFLSVSLTNFGGDAFDSDALPADLDFDQWQVRNFAVEVLVGPTYWNAAGVLESFSSRIVPAPATAIVLASIGVLRARRRR